VTSMERGTSFRLRCNKMATHTSMLPSTARDTKGPYRICSKSDGCGPNLNESAAHATHDHLVRATVQQFRAIVPIARPNQRENDI
jgi:hypothetical protein